MVFELKSLLDLRRDAENAAKRALASAAASVLKAEEEQARLTRHWQAACAALAGETQRLSKGPSPSTAAQGAAGQAYLGRLREEVNRLKAVAEEHRMTAVAAAQASHRAALADCEKALRNREAVATLEEKAQTAAAKIAARKAEDEATDLANASRRLGRQP
jgi:flagellar biosynthesis chaperone FliJ